MKKKLAEIILHADKNEDEVSQVWGMLNEEKIRRRGGGEKIGGREAKIKE